jgi:hypothetical protein
MRTAIFLGLLAIAAAIEKENFSVDKETIYLLSFVIGLFITMDFIELLKKIKRVCIKQLYYIHLIMLFY